VKVLLILAKNWQYFSVEYCVPIIEIKPMTTATIAPPIDNSAIATGQKPQQRDQSPVDSQRLFQAQNTSANDTLDPRELDASRYQFRKQPNPKAKAELAESIGVKGITNPLLVQTSRKAIIAGFTRHEIAIEGEFTLQRSTIPNDRISIRSTKPRWW
jgi:ParB-like nuclease domain